MAVLDPNSNVIVISVVYDGPPEAGKTTSVRALGRSVGREVYTPEERNGRTVFFDWMEYTGGRFEGSPIRCQIASVPGQVEWARRRARFLDRADVVIFVGDTTIAEWPATLARLRDLQLRLRARDGVPVGVVFQANKRDRPDAVPIEDVRHEMAIEGIGVVESIAHEGSGIREAFVLGVRLALDRVREEQRIGKLPMGPPTFERGEEMLSALRAMEADGIVEEAAQQAAQSPRTPLPPSPAVPIGVIWPPVDGRVILHEIAALNVRVRVNAAGDCVAGLGTEWRVYSYADAVFDELETGRAELVAWARQHASNQALLSRPRCIVLAETGDGRWRLWQIVKQQPSLREVGSEWLRSSDPSTVVRGMTTVGRLLFEARQLAAQASLALPWDLDTIGAVSIDRPVFVGLVPPPTAAAPRGAEQPSVTHELALLFRERAPHSPTALRDAFRSHVKDTSPATTSQISQLLAGMFDA